MSAATTKPVVLVVEDEVLIRMNTVEIIKDAGFDVLEAANADEAIVLLEARLDIQVVFTDIDMPGSMNGIKLAQAVRGRWPPIKIIATSGHFKLRRATCPTMGAFCRSPIVQSRFPTFFGTSWRRKSRAGIFSSGFATIPRRCETKYRPYIAAMLLDRDSRPQ